ncbi:MAG: MaoC/PaaZ C-terminal domain-containing protein [Acidimicrobiia bacterium]
MTNRSNLVYFEDLEVGMELWGTEEVANRDEMLGYARRYDPWPMHIDEEAAAQSPFGELVASGGYTISLWYRSGHGIWHRPDWTAAFLGGFDWQVKFPQPLRPGEKVRARSVISDMRRSSKPGRGVVTHKSDLLNQEGDTFLVVDVVFLIATRPETS